MYQNNDKNCKFKVWDHGKISKYRTFYTPSLFKKDFVIRKIKNAVPLTPVIKHLNEEWNCWELLRMGIGKNK